MSLAASDLVALTAAVPLAALGGEAFLKGVLGISAGLRIPKFLVATTFAAFATSSPELTVSSIAALAGKPQIGLGDALGSNVVNIALILGLALLFAPIRVALGETGASRWFHGIRRDFILALLAPLVTLGLLADGVLSRMEGGLLLLVFTGWLAAVVRHALQARGTVPENAPRPHLAVLFAIGGLAAMLLAGRLFVSGASGIALAMHIDAYVIGATVVAIGTSLPELVTMLLARLRGHDDIGLGAMLGSNLFNGLFIVGVAAAIHPIHAPLAEIAITTGFGVFSLLLVIPRRNVISRLQGGVLLAAYAAFVAVTLFAARG